MMMSVPFSSFASSTVDDVISYYNIPTSNVNGQALNRDILEQYKQVVYGDPNGDTKNGEYRYLGYDYEGRKFSNTLFPPDVDATGSVVKSWISDPWYNETALQKFDARRTPYSNDSSATEWLNSMLDPYDTTGKTTWLTSYNVLTGAGWTADTLLDYVVIQSPPTQFGQGVAIMYNTDGKWYQDFVIPPLTQITDLPDPTPTPTPDPTPTPTPTPDPTPGTSGQPNLGITTLAAACDKDGNMTVKITAVNSVDTAVTTTLVVKVDGTVLSTETVTLNPGQTKLFIKTYPCPAAGKKAEALINPDRDQPPTESTWLDNEKETDVLKEHDPGQVSTEEKYLQMKFGDFAQPVQMYDSFSVPIKISNNSDKPRTTSLDFTMTSGTIKEAYIVWLSCGLGCSYPETRYRNMPLTISGKSPTFTILPFGSVTWTVSDGLDYAISGGNPSSQSGQPLNVKGPVGMYGVPDYSAHYFPEITVSATNPDEYVDPVIEQYVGTNYPAPSKPKVRLVQ